MDRLDRLLTLCAAVVTVNAAQTVTLPDNDIPDDPTAAEPITDTYQPAPGALTVTKTIAGAAAGQQGAVVLHVSCDNGLEQDITIPAGTIEATNRTITDLPAGTICTVTEPTDGGTAAITVTTTLTGNPATVPAGDTAAVQITDTYTADVQPMAPPVPPAPVGPVNPVHPSTPTPAPVLASTGFPASLPGIAEIGLLLIIAGSLMQIGRKRARTR